MQKNILEYLEKTAARLPDKVAFSTGKESMTFGEVQIEAWAIGSKLLSLGLSGESVVIFMDKHPKTVTAFWGVIYAGCFYVCIDEKMPVARIESIIGNVCPRAIIADRKNLAVAESLGVENTLLTASSRPAITPAPRFIFVTIPPTPYPHMHLISDF